MKDDTLLTRLLTLLSLALWAVVVLLPLGFLTISVIKSGSPVEEMGVGAGLWWRTFGLSIGIASASVLLGILPGKLLARRSGHSGVLFFLLLMPLVLPRYVLYYAWSLLLSPTTWLGQLLSQHSDWARGFAFAASVLVLVLWYWPIAALLIGQGYRQIDREIVDSARLESGSLNTFSKIILPLLKGPLLLAFAVCFVLALSEFSTFHLAGFETLGTHLAFLYQLTGSETVVAMASLPICLVALVIGSIVTLAIRNGFETTTASDSTETTVQSWHWFYFIVLAGISLLIPIGLLVLNASQLQPFRDFLTLHMDELGWSFLIAASTAVLAHAIAYGAITVEAFGRFGKLAATPVRLSLFVVMFLPASVIAVSLLRLFSGSGWLGQLGQSWVIVCMGQTLRFSGVALILMLLLRQSQSRHLTEIARLDGAGRWAIWWQIHFPRSWPVLVGSFLLITMLSVTELSATMVLLPPGLPSFSQRLLNQMHYVRDQQVIASCLILIGAFFLLTLFIILMLRLIKHRAALVVLCVLVGSSIMGCDESETLSLEPKVLYSFGQTGRGQGEFHYPRACDLANNEFLWVIDKTGRVQCFNLEGIFQKSFPLPDIDAGKPTGISLGPDGHLYVADTHYHRVAIFSDTGEFLEDFGRFGQNNGEFIYPTDVAFAPDGRIYVSEYGGNDRISVFSPEKKFLFSFGSPGSMPGQMSRPSALCVDKQRERLYVADACNHRIAVYDLQGNLTTTIGSLGTEQNRLRYPYDLTLLEDGTLVVCEYGNNRIQLFDPNGQSLAVWGQPGRQLGQLAYPWAVSVDHQRRAFIIDAGNNRVQVWQL